MGLKNLLEETIGCLKAHGKYPADVLWVSTDDARMSWDCFAEAANTKYNPGYGCNEVRGDLRVDGNGWWLERREYDGSEWWEFNAPRPKPEVESKFGLFCRPF